MADLKNKKEEATNKEILLAGMNGDFWNLIVQALDDQRENLVTVQNGDSLRDLPPEEYKRENELMKAKLKYIELLKQMPVSVISWLQDPDNAETNYDPYEPRVGS